MEKRQLGKTDMQVTVLGFGAAEIGFENATQETVNALLASALDAGLNVIDTAALYRTSEEMIGTAVSGRRRDYHLFTKCGNPMNPASDEWRPEALLASIERSLQRLRTDHLDLVQLHSCSEQQLRQGDVIAALRTARERGWTRYLGYSGDGAAARYAIECGQFDTLQTSVSIADQEAIDLTLPLALARGVGVIVKRPIANAAWRTGQKPANPYQHTYWDRLQALAYPFLQGGLDAAVATALRFTLSVPGVHTAIVGTTRPGRWKENAALLAAGPLPTAEFEAIRARWRAVAAATWTGQT